MYHINSVDRMNRAVGNAAVVLRYYYYYYYPLVLAVYWLLVLHLASGIQYLVLVY
jgi:hypothetical protein